MLLNLGLLAFVSTAILLILCNLPVFETDSLVWPDFVFSYLKKNSLEFLKPFDINADHTSHPSFPPQIPLGGGRVLKELMIITPLKDPSLISNLSSFYLFCVLFLSSFNQIYM